MSILDEIKKQPQRTREIMFYLSVIIVISVIGSLWLHSFQKNVYALLNPNENFDKKFYAQSGQGILGKSWGGLRAALDSVLNIGSNSTKVEQTPAPVYTLPLAPDKNY